MPLFVALEIISIHSPQVLKCCRQNTCMPGQTCLLQGYNMFNLCFSTHIFATFQASQTDVNPQMCWPFLKYEPRIPNCRGVSRYFRTRQQFCGSPDSIAKLDCLLKICKDDQLFFRLASPISVLRSASFQNFQPVASTLSGRHGRGEDIDLPLARISADSRCISASTQVLQTLAVAG